jgi:predicted N-formylglutamate amidohydrolase
MTAPRLLPGGSDILIIADHASSAVPPRVDLGIDSALFENHIAVDIGTAALAESLAQALAATAIIAVVSRLVIDCNREPDAADVIPVASDGHIVAGNLGLNVTERALRIDAIHRPYHAAIARQIARARPKLIISLHSFTPHLATRPDEARPWPAGILHNCDDRAAILALEWLASTGLPVGDNRPYSGRDLNYTMNTHAERNEIPYVCLEIRQDGLADPAGIAHWAGIVARMVPAVAARLVD